MIKIFRCLVLWFLCFFVSSDLVAGTLPNQVIKNQILKDLKAGEEAFENYKFIAELKQIKDKKVVNQAKFLVLVSGEDAIAYFLEPYIDRGKIVLQKGSAYFLYFPKPKRYIRVSAQANLFGSVSYGDLIKPPLLKYYKVTDMHHLEDKNDVLSINFKLDEGIRDFPFYKKTVEYNNREKKILSVKSYSRSDILLGEVKHKKFISLSGMYFPLETTILDIKDQSHFSKQKNSALSFIQVPQKYYSPASLRYVERYVKSHVLK